MKVRVDSMAWLSKADLTTSALQALRQSLTIVPKKFAEYEDDDEDGPLFLFRETETEFGMPREYFLANKKPHHEVDLETTEGNLADWPGALTFNPERKLRQQQTEAVGAVVTGFRADKLGGIVKACPGFGKCLRGDCWTVDQRTGERRRLDELVGQIPLVPSLSETGSIVAAESSRVWCSGYKPCLRLTLASGQSIVGSEDHPVLTQRGYVRLSALVASDFVGTARQVPAPERVLETTDAEAALVGALLADGRTKATITYHKGDRSLVDLVIKLASELPEFEGVGVDYFDRGCHTVSLLGIHNIAKKWGIRDLSKDKRVPTAFFGLSNTQLGMFLRWLYTDAHVAARARGPALIELTLASEGLIDDVQYLLKRFGIRSAKYYKRATIRGVDGTAECYDAWRLTVSGRQDLELFMTHIGPIPGKIAACAALAAKVAATKANTSYDVAPVDCESIAELNKCSVKSSWKRLLSSHGIGRERFKRVAAKVGYQGPILDLVNADLVWERIRSITEEGTFPVYDLTVPATHNAIVGGIVVHNTVIGCAVAAEMGVPTLVVVHKTFLLNQWKERIEEYLPGAKVGIARQKRCDFRGKHVVIGMIHSLVRDKYPKEFYEHFGLVITDEVHRLGARTFSLMPERFRARWRLALSATPRRKDGCENVFYYHEGPIVYEATERRLKPLIKRVYSSFRLVQTPSFNPKLAPESLVLSFLCANEPRNRKIVELAIEALHTGRKLLILSKRINHLNRLDAMLRQEWESRKLGPPPSIDYYIGGRSEEALYKASFARVIFATSQFASEGLDVPALDTLFLVIPMSDVEQAVGRICREFEGKRTPIVVDVRDDMVGRFKGYGANRDRLYERIS